MVWVVGPLHDDVCRVVGVREGKGAGVAAPGTHLVAATRARADTVRHVGRLGVVNAQGHGEGFAVRPLQIDNLIGRARAQHIAGIGGGGITVVWVVGPLHDDVCRVVGVREGKGAGVAAPGTHLVAATRARADTVRHVGRLGVVNAQGHGEGFAVRPLQIDNLIGRARAQHIAGIGGGRHDRGRGGQGEQQADEDMQQRETKKFGQHGKPL